MFTSELLLPIASMVKTNFPCKNSQSLETRGICFVFYIFCTEKKMNRDREIKHKSITNPLITLITSKRKTRPFSWYQRCEKLMAKKERQKTYELSCRATRKRVLPWKYLFLSFLPLFSNLFCPILITSCGGVFKCLNTILGGLSQ